MAGSSVKKEPKKAKYSRAVPGATMRKLAKGSSKGNPPNTASCTGNVPNSAAAVAARDSAGKRHSLAKRPFTRSSNKVAKGWYNSTMPKVAVTDRAKPRSPPAKGLNRHTTSTARPREFKLSARRPKESAKSSTPYMAAPRVAEGWNPERDKNSSSARPVRRFPTALRTGSRFKSRWRNAANTAMCIPETTRMWDTPSPRKLALSSWEMPLPSPSTMARRNPASRRGSRRSSSRLTWRRSWTKISPGDRVGFSSTTMPSYWDRYPPAW